MHLMLSDSLNIIENKGNLGYMFELMGNSEKALRYFETYTQLKDSIFSAYLRMNLSTKEIPQMLNIGTDSVTTKRYRLRKKLALDKEENLVGFIGGF